MDKLAIKGFVISVRNKLISAILKILGGILE